MAVKSYDITDVPSQSMPQQFAKDRVLCYAAICQQDGQFIFFDGPDLKDTISNIYMAPVPLDSGYCVA